jgi:hypothetical protein
LPAVVFVDIDNFGMHAFRQSVCHPSLIGGCRFISSAARTKATHSICEHYVSCITSFGAEMPNGVYCLGKISSGFNAYFILIGLRISKQNPVMRVWIVGEPAKT